MVLNAEKKMIGRRNFLKATALLPAVGAVTWKASTQGPVKAGIVGTGMEGRILISNADPNYLYLTACCDIRPDNRELGSRLIQNPALGHHPDPQVYDDYEEMLNSADIEAVLIATPLHQHGPMALKALEAGKHVFVEKTMAYCEKECLDMVRLAQAKRLNLQVGHQRFYNPLYWDAYRMVQDGLLGNIYHIRALWHRNNDWNYWTHVWKESTRELQAKLMNMDPQKYGYENIQQLVNWRWYQEMSHGLWTELCSHQIAITNWFLGSMPMVVYASGGKYKTDVDQEELYENLRAEYDTMKKYNATNGKTFEQFRDEFKNYQHDDRTIPDHIYAIYEYPDNCTVTYSAIQSSSVDQYYEEIMGTRGTIILSNENEFYLFWEPGWDEAKSQAAKETEIEVTSEEVSEMAFAGHISEEAKGSGGASDMSPFDPYKWELQGFAHTIRTGAPNLCDGIRATQAATACFYGKESLDKKQRIEIPNLVV